MSPYAGRGIFRAGLERPRSARSSASTEASAKRTSSDRRLTTASGWIPQVNLGPDNQDWFLGAKRDDSMPTSAHPQERKDGRLTPPPSGPRRALLGPRRDAACGGIGSLVTVRLLGVPLPGDPISPGGHNDVSDDTGSTVTIVIAGRDVHDRLAARMRIGWVQEGEAIMESWR